jgi:hypothetical protein
MQERWRTDRHPDSETWAGVEKRRSRRLEVDSLARVKIMPSSFPSAPSLGARVLSVSVHGLQFEVGFILPNTPVEVQVFNRVVSGDVRYCVSVGQDFRVGVRLHGGF